MYHDPESFNDTTILLDHISAMKGELVFESNTTLNLASGLSQKISTFEEHMVRIEKQISTLPANPTPPPSPPPTPTLTQEKKTQYAKNCAVARHLYSY